MVAVFFNPTPTAHQMFDLISEEHSLRCLPWDVWCWRSELVVVQAGWRWGLHHYYAPHSISPTSDKFKEFAKQHLLKNPDFPAAVCYISSTLLKFPGIKEKKNKASLALLQSIITLWLRAVVACLRFLSPQSDSFSLVSIDLQLCPANIFLSVRPFLVLHLLSIIHHSALSARP